MAIAILVVGACIALTLDRLWINAAQSELQTAAEAGALAGAARLAQDDSLNPDLDEAARAEAVRTTASAVANANSAAGKSPSVNSEPFGDVRLGRVVVNGNVGQAQFLETDSAATSVLVTARSDRRNGNAVGLFFPFLTGQPTANIQVRAEASINNAVIGVRPLDNAPAPMWPLGVLESHLDPRRLDTWLIQIEGRAGADNYGFNHETNEVVEEADGLPEILLFAPDDGDDDDRPCNMTLVDIGTGLDAASVERQFEHGVSWQDLQDFGSEFVLGTDHEQMLAAITDFRGGPESRIEQLAGQSRIIVLYRELTPAEDEPLGRVLATRLAAGRIMRASSVAGGMEIVLQPSVVTTRTALTGGGAASESSLNPYIYKLSLTY